MSDKQAKGGCRWWLIPVRVAAVLLLALMIGALLNWIAASLERSARPAGFTRGLVQGALMPMSFPNLLVGHDVTIYSAKNNGIGYKLGYTAGVNGCGAIFFGILFWRLNRLRKWAGQGRNA